MDQETFNKMISLARTRLISAWPFIGHLALSLRPRMAGEHDGVPTAAVSIDGTLIVNPDFMEKLKPEEVCGLLAHEVLHPALFCWARQGDRRDLVEVGGQVISLWNLAHDLSFNTMIEAFGKGQGNNRTIKLPDGAAIDAQFDGQAAEEIYDKLLKEAKKNPSKAMNGTGQATGKLPGRSSSIGDDMRNDLAESKDGQKAARGDSTANKKLEQEWKVSVVAAAQEQERSKRGTLPGWLQRIIHEILNPKLDWREELSRWLGENGPRNDYSFKRPSRRSEAAGEYLPSLTKHGICDDVTVLLDTSGSIGQDRLKEALAEIQGVADDLSVTVRVIVVDADIHDDITTQDAMEVAERLKGGGGSDFGPAFDRLEKESYDGIVVAITDGCIGVPGAQPPQLRGVLWVLHEGEPDPTAGKWGEVVRIPQEKEGAKAKARR